jgi:hypothetical protein
MPTAQSEKPADVAFQDLFAGGSVIRGAPVDRAVLEACISELNDRHNLSVRLTDEALDLLSEFLPRVAGSFEGDLAPVNRKGIQKRLQKLYAHLAGTIELLRPVRLGLLEDREMHFAHFLTQIVIEEHPGMSGNEARDQLETALKVLERLERYCERALVKATLTPAKTGRRSHDFYDAYVALMVKIGRRLGLEPRLPWDPSDPEQETPFTALVFEIERFLPRAAWSNTSAACAKRIERSLKALGIAIRQNSSAP